MGVSMLCFESVMVNKHILIFLNYFIDSECYDDIKKQFAKKIFY